MEIWRRPGVEGACLALQDQHGQCVPLLLWRLWTLRERRAVGADTLAAAIAVAKPWDERLIQPLRALRRSPLVEPARELGRLIAAAEVEAERGLLADLESFPAGDAARAGSNHSALVALAKAWSPKKATPPAALRRLLLAAG